MSVHLIGRPIIPGIAKPVSALALGTAFFRQDNQEVAFALLDDYLALGGTLLDSGRIYGTSENVLGAWLTARGVRERVIVSTKCGHGQDALLPVDNFDDMVSEELALSLEALRTSYVDLYMLHRDNPALPVGRIMDRLAREVRAGRVRALGASNWQYARVEAANAYARAHGLAEFVAVSNNLSLAKPAEAFYPNLVSVDAEGERWHARTGTPLISWSSQARGFFTGQFPRELRERLDRLEDSFQKRMAVVYGTDDNFERLRRAQELGANKGGFSAVQVALAWLLHKPFPVVPIVGPHSREELASCVAATTLMLEAAELDWLDLKR